ncbi:MAG: biopolymer transporter ExbD, partial [Proteobacteria bacterium]|nr:biopolymer transporter ExbD [Pseudomonadota bacterium]
MRFESTRRARRGIGLTPLVDVVFLLLIFFMLASSFSRESAWTIGIANAAAGTPAAQDAPL